MNNRFVLSIVGAMAMLLVAGTASARPLAAPVGTAFTYQGRLTDGGGAANGAYDFEFSLYDAETSGTQVGSTVPLEDVAVADGVFTVQLDFGAVFDGTALWLEIAVRDGASTGAYSTLSPRQPLTPTPYAVYAANAPWSGLSGVPAGFADSVDDDTTYTNGTGLQLVGDEFRVQFAGSGSAGTAARSDHDHWGQAWTGSSGTGLWLSGGDTGLHGEGSTYGVQGKATGTASAGLWGNSDDGYGVFGAGGIAGFDGYGFYGVRGTAFFAGGIGVEGHAKDDTGDYAGQFFGNVRIEGDSTVTGTKSAVVETKDFGTRKLYSIESPQAWFEDFGTGQLQEGAARVTIDPIYAQTVNLEEGYYVFVTALGDCALYVDEKLPTSFSVRAMGSQACSIPFDYRIVAKRLGYENVRLDEVDPHPEAPGSGR